MKLLAAYQEIVWDLSSCHFFFTNASPQPFSTSTGSPESHKMWGIYFAFSQEPELSGEEPGWQRVSGFISPGPSLPRESWLHLNWRD